MDSSPSSLGLPVPNRKRPSTLSLLNKPTDVAGQPPLRKQRKDAKPHRHRVVLENELKTVQSALEHERSLRELDARRAQQVKQRLERKLEFAAEETEQTRAMLEELREQSESHISDLREKLQDTLEELRGCQQRLIEWEATSDDQYMSESIHDHKMSQLEKQLTIRVEEVEALRAELADVKEMALSQLDQKMAAVADEEQQSLQASFAGKASSADSSVLKELNRLRIELAESDRRYRQLCRKADDWKQRSQQLVHQSEAAKSASSRCQTLEQELAAVRKEMETNHATNRAWESFASALGKALSISPLTGGPPEVSAVLRHLQRQTKANKKAELEKESLENQLETAHKQTVALEEEAKESRTLLERAQRDKKEVEKQLEYLKEQSESTKTQEAIWKRESDSLRALLNTFDEVAPNKDLRSAEAEGSKVTISALRDEVKSVKRMLDAATSRITILESESETLQKEHDRVLDKFGKLRSALMEERSKAEKAENRALDAELLAGKGAFNADQTRVLSMERNPLMDAMRRRFQAEIYSLRRRLERMTGQKIPDSVLANPDGVDPEKLHQRLKESFKEQISMFREGVYLITGFKIDMVPKTQSHMSFRVRSVYAEREEDYLEFFWPKGVNNPSSLDLGATEWAKTLASVGHSYQQYLQKFDSVPAFIASAQLELFEKCTVVARG